MKVKLLFLSVFLLFFGFLSFAQKDFKIINRNSEIEKYFFYNRKIVFQLKEDAKCPSFTLGMIDKESRIFELHLTEIDNQNLIFNGYIVVPYSDINWMFIKTPGRVIKQITAVTLFAGLVPIFFIGPSDGATISIFILPISFLLLKSSEKKYFSNKDWAIEPMHK